MATTGYTHPQHKKSTWDRASEALMYIILFPFIAIFIAGRRAFTAQSGGHKSYRDRLPQGRTNG